MRVQRRVAALLLLVCVATSGDSGTCSGHEACRSAPTLSIIYITKRCMLTLCIESFAALPPLAWEQPAEGRESRERAREIAHTHVCGALDAAVLPRDVPL
jgi:hypothetical protein